MNSVDQFLENLEHPLIDLIRTVRAEVLATDLRLTEHIKWNAPSFCLDGDDRITMKLFPPRAVQLVFHRGTKKQEMPATRLLEEDFGRLKWAANDRAVATFVNLEDFTAQKDDIAKLVRAWLAAS